MGILLRGGLPVSVRRECLRKIFQMAAGAQVDFFAVGDDRASADLYTCQ
jgi:hypothetical protein